jgi:Tol biopolymer transport system component
MAVTGVEVPVVEEVATDREVGFADYSFSDSGLLAYSLGGASRQGMATLEWADRKGVRQPVAGPAQAYVGLRLSPDGERVAAVIRGSVSDRSDVWVYEFARGTLSRVTFDGNNSNPVWTPDGRRIAFHSVKNGKHGMYWVPADGSSQPELLFANDKPGNPTSWSPDGKVLIFAELDAQNRHLRLLPTPGSAGDGKPHEFLHTTFSEGAGQFSPDGKWVAYQSNEAGDSQIYVRPYPGPGGKIQISTQPGSNFPRWAGGGRELFYRNGDEIWVVDIQPGPTLRASQPHALFSAAGPFEVSPDGKRILLMKSLDVSPGGGTMVFVGDWFEDLRRRVPIRK